MTFCPGLYALAPARDGPLARLRLPGGILTAGQGRGLADVAARLGNGIVDLTRRGNLQVRGVNDGAAFAAGIAGLGLAPMNRQADRRRNILADPLAGIDPTAQRDMRPITSALDRAVQAADGLDGLSPKVSIVLDGGGACDVIGLPHDIGLRAEGKLLRLSLAGRDTRLGLAPGDAARIVIDLLRGLADAGPTARMDRARTDGLIRAIRGVALPNATPRAAPWAMIGRIGAHLGLGVPGARLGPAMLAGLADLALAHGDGTLRLSPAHSVILPHADAAAEACAEALGLFTHAPDLRLVACAGATGCARGRADTKGDARALGAMLAGTTLRGVVHLTGCPRGCAHPGDADATLLARADGRGYDLAGTEADGLSLAEAAAALRARLG